MKTKNLFLGLAATAFAITGVYASSFVVAKSVRIPSSPGGSLVCKRINVECGTGTAACRVTITNPPTGVSPGPYNVFQQDDCTVQIVTAQSSTAIPAALLN